MLCRNIKFQSKGDTLLEICAPRSCPQTYWNGFRFMWRASLTQEKKEPTDDTSIDVYSQ